MSTIILQQNAASNDQVKQIQKDILSFGFLPDMVHPACKIDASYLFLENKGDVRYRGTKFFEHDTFSIVYTIVSISTVTNVYYQIFENTHIFMDNAPDIMDIVDGV